MFSDLKPYSEYKESKAPWLGLLPAHWDYLRSKYLFREVDERSSTGNEELLSVSHLTGVTPRSQKTITMFLAETNVGHKVCRPGDIVINTMWAWMAALGVSRHAGIVSPAYGVYRPLASCAVLPRYADHLLRTATYAAEYQRRSTGVNSSRLRLYPEQFLRIEVVVPPHNEQAAIVRFLDWANRRLEEAVRAKRKVIALLNEQKQVIIHHAVTRGLDPSVPTKPSGIPWLGDIPQHWEVRALKRVVATKITDGPHETPEFLEDGIDFMSAESMVNGNLVFDRRRGFISPALHRQYCVKCKPQRDDVFICKSGATTGKVAIVETDKEFSVWSPLALLRADVRVMLPRFLFASLQTRYVQQQVQERWSFGTQPNLAMGALGRIAIAVPSASEQAAALARIDEESTPLTIAIFRLEREIDFLREYRTRLVADVVSGKLDVRGMVNQLPPETQESTLQEGLNEMVEEDQESGETELVDAAGEAEA
jgi:type I restriction enzyme, S subunit